MYHPWLAVLGVILVVIVVFDLLSTTIHIGEGLLTKVIQYVVSRIISKLHMRSANRALLAWSNVFIIMSLVLVWIHLLWVGWLLIFCSAEGAVIRGSTGAPADFWSRVYFTGFTISTLGTGDIRPSGALYQQLTAAASLNGFFLLTFVITYIVPIAQGQFLRREIALHIAHTGTTPQALILAHWQNHEYAALHYLLNNITSDLVRLEQVHRSIPMLHHFSGPSRNETVELSIATLDEALSLLECGMRAPMPETFVTARRAITGYLDSMKDAWIAPADEAPPIPPTDKLREHGMSVSEPDELEERFRVLDERRRYLYALVEKSGWVWEVVHRWEYDDRYVAK